MAKLTKNQDTAITTSLLDDAFGGLTNVGTVFSSDTSDAEAKEFISRRSAGRGSLTMGLVGFYAGARLGDKVPFLGTKRA